MKTKKRSSPEIECVFGPNKVTKWYHPKMVTPGAGRPHPPPRDDATGYIIQGRNNVTKMRVD